MGVPVAVAVGLPLALARFSLLAAGLSLFVSALLLLTAAVTAVDLHANTLRRRTAVRPVHHLRPDTTAPTAHEMRDAA
jgi:hypothetical protein